MTISKSNIADEFLPGIHQDDLEDFAREHFEFIDNVTNTTGEKPIAYKSGQLLDVHPEDLQEFNREHFKTIDTINKNQINKGQGVYMIKK